MTNPLQPFDPDAKDWPRTVAEAVDRLVRELTQAEKDAITALPESDLSLLHFSLGMSIRNVFELWHDNNDLLMDCQRIKFKDSPAIPDDLLSELPEEWFEVAPEISDKLMFIQPDDASRIIIRALWARLRH